MAFSPDSVKVQVRTHGKWSLRFAIPAGWFLFSTFLNQFRFAEFVDGSPHLTEEEVMSYSTWSSDDEEDRRYTDLPDHLFEEMTDDEEEMIELGHRFWCSLCAPIHLGHRFTCGLCAFQATTKGR